MGRRSDIKPLPSVARLNELLSYNEETGVLTWKILPATSRSSICRNNKCGGKVAGTVGTKGYIMIGIGKVYYLAHRIIWKMMTGIDPADQIDHKDTNRSNNRWSNLRQTTNGTNIQNSRLRKDNTSGFKGVTFSKTHQKWRATLVIGAGKTKHLGHFDCAEEAGTVWQEAAKQHRGEFARAA